MVLYLWFFAGKFLTELSLRFRFQNEIKRGLSGSPELAEPGLFHDLSQSTLSSLRSERQADLLAARSGQADHCRKSIVDSSYWIQVFFQGVSCQRFDNHPSAVRLQAFACVRGRSHRITHVMQRVKRRDKVIASRKPFGRGGRERDVGQPFLACPLARPFDRSGM